MMRSWWALLLGLLLVACQPQGDDQPEPPAGVDVGGLKLFSASLGDDSIPGDVQLRGQPISAQPSAHQASAQSLRALGQTPDSDCPTERAAPYDADRLNVGLYWYAAGTKEAPGGVSCRARSDGRAIPGYYDPGKPVIILVHGWNNGYISRSVVPGTTYATRRENFWFNAAQQNVADAWLAAGWNVGLYQWTQLADDEGTLFMPYNVQAKIWTAHYHLNDGTPVEMRYRVSSGGYSTSDMPQVSAGELLYREYKSALSQWKYRGNSGLRLMGHSLGAQMILSLGDRAYHDPALPEWERPRRLILADPYWTPVAIGKHNYAYLAPDSSPAYHSARLAWELQQKGVAIEWIKSSRLLDMGGDNNAGLLKITSRTQIDPGYLNWLDFSGRHGAAPRWYMWTHSFDLPQLTASASYTDQYAYQNMRAVQHVRQIAGGDTPTPADDRFALLDP